MAFSLCYTVFTSSHRHVCLSNDGNMLCVWLTPIALLMTQLPVQVQSGVHTVFTVCVCVCVCVLCMCLLLVHFPKCVFKVCMQLVNSSPWTPIVVMKENTTLPVKHYCEGSPLVLFLCDCSTSLGRRLKTWSTGRRLSCPSRRNTPGYSWRDTQVRGGGRCVFVGRVSLRSAS